jgi:peptidoglycan hydrolase-like protein with peptidoglycan-binding domain
VPKRKPKAVAIKLEARETGGIGSIISTHPREFVAILLGGTAVTIICFNALFMQKGPHPAPIFAARPALIAPPPAPVIAAPARLTAPAPLSPTQSQPQPAIAAPPLNRVQTIAEIQRELTRRGFYDGVADGIWGAKTDAGARDFGQSAGVKVDPNAPEDLLRAMTASSVSAPVPAPQAAPRDQIAALLTPSPRILAIQRALADFGYGQIKPTGNFDADTRVAIEKFERDRRLPVTGQVSDRFVRELSAMTGRPLE